MKIIIILGEKLKENGQMSLNLKYRLDKGAELYNKNNLIIVSGGNVQQSVRFPEAHKMKRYLIKTYGIKTNNIIEERSSQDTIENAKYCLEIINNRKNVSEIIIVSSEFHIKRVEYIFNYYFRNVKFPIHFNSSKNGVKGKLLIEKIRNEEKYLKLFIQSILFN